MGHRFPQLLRYMCSTSPVFPRWFAVLDTLTTCPLLVTTGVWSWTVSYCRVSAVASLWWSVTSPSLQVQVPMVQTVQCTTWPTSWLCIRVGPTGVGCVSVCFPRFLVQALSCPALHHGVHYLVQGVLRAAQGLQTFRLGVPRLSHAYGCFRWSSILASMFFAVRGFCSRVGGHISRVVGHSSGVGNQSPRVGGHSPSVVVSLPVVVPQLRLLDRSVRPVWWRLHRSGSCTK